MAFKGWDKTLVRTSDGEVEGIAPLIISASRSTDIPAFHSEWLMQRLRTGYVKWINPFNQKPQYVSFEKARVFVFWTKNPQPLMRFLPELDKAGIQYYFTFTLNDYDGEQWEPGVPPLIERIAIFKELSEQIGKHKVVWRFDPILLTREVTVDTVLKKIARVGSELHKHTEKLVISFADIERYAKVSRNLKQSHIEYQPISRESMEAIACGVGRMGKEWNISVATCAEDVDLSAYGVYKNRCIDAQLMIKAFNHDVVLMNFLGYQAQVTSLFSDTPYALPTMKDPGQRRGCGCMVSKDIGHYNTCLHLCKYCYANTSEAAVRKKLHTLATSDYIAK